MGLQSGLPRVFARLDWIWSGGALAAVFSLRDFAKRRTAEHFAMKPKPVHRNKMGQNKGIERGFDSIQAVL